MENIWALVSDVLVLILIGADLGVTFLIEWREQYFSHAVDAWIK